MRRQFLRQASSQLLFGKRRILPAKERSDSVFTVFLLDCDSNSLQHVFELKQRSLNFDEAYPLTASFELIVFATEMFQEIGLIFSTEISGSEPFVGPEAKAFHIFAGPKGGSNMVSSKEDFASLTRSNFGVIIVQQLDFDSFRWPPYRNDHPSNSGILGDLTIRHAAICFGHSKPVYQYRVPSKVTAK